MKIDEYIWRDFWTTEAGTVTKWPHSFTAAYDDDGGDRDCQRINIADEEI